MLPREGRLKPPRLASCSVAPLSETVAGDIEFVVTRGAVATRGAAADFERRRENGTGAGERERARY